MIKNSVILMGVFLLAACGKNDKGDVRSENDSERNLPRTGELSKAADELLRDEWSEVCDRRNENLMREVTAVLDSKHQEISEYAATIPATDTRKNVAFGNSYLKEYIKLPYERVDSWSADEESWSQVDDLYAKIKKQPVNDAWVGLNVMVRSLLVNDEMRILDGMNMELDHASSSKVEALKKLVENCVNQESCTELNFVDELNSFVKGNEYYASFANKIATSTEVEKKRDYLTRFLKRLTNDGKRYAFRASETIVSTLKDGKTVYELPIFSRDFNETQRKQIASYVEPVWSNDTLVFQLKWVQPIAEIFEIIFDATRPGERAGVTWSKKLIEIFAGTKTKAVAHEFGHVLGFRDRYYTKWESSQCRYIVEGNTMDIMSDTIGVVMPDEWADLRANYGK